MKIDKNKVITREPLMLCESCFRQNCNGDCILIIRFIRWISGVKIPIKKDKIKEFIINIFSMKSDGLYNNEYLREDLLKRYYEKQKNNRL